MIVSAGETEATTAVLTLDGPGDDRGLLVFEDELLDVVLADTELRVAFAVDGVVTTMALHVRYAVCCADVVDVWSAVRMLMYNVEV